MSVKTSNQLRLGVSVVVAVFAILMIVVVPLVANSMINPIVQGQLDRTANFKAQGTADGATQAALLGPAPWLVSFLFPFWSTLTFIAGFALLVTLANFYRGEAWTRGFALLMFAIPSIGGAYMLIPWINFIGSVKGGFPPAVIIMAIGLIPYFTVLLADKGDLVQKVVDFAVFLMLGVTAAESFSNGHASFRVLYGHPKRPFIVDDIAPLWLSSLGLFAVAALLIAAIYLLGNRKVSGWYVGMIAGLSALVASGVTHYFRHATNDYLYGALMGLSIVVLLVIPVVKQRLLEGSPSEAKKPQAQILQAKPA